MPHPACSDIAYINFLVASPRDPTATEAARVAPGSHPPAHDAFTRLLHRLEPDPETLWREAAPLVARGKGVLVVDDSTLDKPYATKMELVTRHWSGKHRRVVSGINLITLLWTEGESLIPVDYRVYDKGRDGLSKNDHFLAMLRTAHGRGFTPECVVFDSWYASLANLKAIRGMAWRWLTQLRSNRRVSVAQSAGNRAVRDQPIDETGTRVHLEAYGWVRVFRLVATDGDTEHWATSDTAMDEGTRRKYAEFAWGIEVYHRTLKQVCHVERAQVRAARAQRNHIGLAIRAFLRLEQHRLVTGVSGWAAKQAIVRDAVRSYLAHPRYTLRSTPWVSA
jgi:putative transposase